MRRAENPGCHRSCAEKPSAIRTLIPLAILLFGLGCTSTGPIVYARPVVATPSADEGLCGLPDSIRLKLLATLARGDVPGVIGMWQLHTGKDGVVPRALQAMQTAYQATNQQKGACQQVARKIHEGFKFLEGDQKYVHISSSAARAQFMSWQNRIVFRQQLPCRRRMPGQVL
jgi:hypothetical protein